MVSLEEFKKAMGSESEKYSDAELINILKHQERLADVFFDHWIDSLDSSQVVKLTQDAE